MNQVKLGLLCLSLLAFFGCPPPVTRVCSSTTCPGCCDANGECQSGLTVTACGTSGNDCRVCGTNQTCNSGQCNQNIGGGFTSAGGTAGGGMAGDGGVGGGAAGGTVLSCASGLTLCFNACVNTRTDYSHCGMCGRSCGSGQYCDNNQCQNVPTTCSGQGTCPTNYFCSSQNTCVLGCQTSADCGGGQVCDTTNSRCKCPNATNLCGGSCLPANTVTACGAACLNCSGGPNSIPSCTNGACDFTCQAGYHRCGNACVSNFDAMTCGNRCAACQVPPNGTATCDGTDCGYTCAQGFHQCGTDCVSNFDVATCGNSCSPCQAPANGIAQCMSSGGAPACTFTCNPGYVKCGNACVQESATACGPTCQTCTPPVGATNPQCVNSACQYTCATGFHQCGNSCASNTALATCGTNCTPCPTPLNGIATCNGTSCGIMCNAGYHECNGQCVSNFATATCGSRCTACPDGPVGSGTTTTCDGVACGLRCSSTATPNFCGNTCVADSLTTCGTSCQTCTAPSGATPICQNGICDFNCGTGFHRCGSQCVADDSVNNCGTSCSVCPPGPPNTMPTCTRPTATSPYACGWNCGAGTTLCNSQCVPLDFTTACGPSCGVCSSINSLERGICSNGICSTGCITSCSGTCVNSQTSATNCGTCGTTCSGADRCSQGECRNYCATGIALGSMAPGLSLGYTPLVLSVVDINDDRRPDLIAYDTSYYLTVRLGQANGSFGAIAWSYYLGSSYQPSQIVVGDLTGDTLPEIAVAVSSYAYVYLFRNTGVSGGSASFSTYSVSTTYVPTGLAIGDFNGTTPKDLLVSVNTTSATSSTLLFPGTAAAGVSPVGTAIPGGLGIGTVSGARAALLNQDPNPELVVTAGSNAIYLYPGTGSPTSPFNPSMAVLAQLPAGESFSVATGSSFPFAVGDVTGDGYPDAVVATSSGAGTIFGVRVFPMMQNLTFGTSTLLPVPAVPRSIAISDVNLDARPDVIVASSDVRIFLSQAGGTFSAAQVLGISFSATSLNSLAAADTTGDSAPELFTPSGTSIVTAVNNGMGGFASLQGTSVPNASRIAVGDLNGDGYTDVAATGLTFQGTDARLADVTMTSTTVRGRIEVLVNGTWGSVCAAPSPTSTTVNVACASVGLGTSYTYSSANVAGLAPVMKGPSCLAGTTSLLSCSYTAPDSACTGMNNLLIECYLPTTGAIASQTQILFGSSTGGFTAGPLLQQTRGDRAAIGNLNGDSSQDLVTAAQTVVDGGVGYVLEVRNGATNSTLGTPSTLTARAVPTFITIAEVSGDAQQDIIVGSALGIDVYRNTGGSFAAPVAVSTLGASSIAVGDFNADGRRDLAALNTGYTSVLPLMNVALPNNVGFIPGGALSVSAPNFNVLAGDVTYDGKIDLIVGRYVYQGNGAGGFTLYTSSLAVQPPRQVLVDLDADGSLDLIAAGAGSSVLSVLGGTSTTAYGFPTTASGFSPGALVEDVAVGKTNSDGRRDLIVLQGSAGARSIVAAPGVCR